MCSKDLCVPHCVVHGGSDLETGEWIKKLAEIPTRTVLGCEERQNQALSQDGAGTCGSPWVKQASQLCRIHRNVRKSLTLPAHASSLPWGTESSGGQGRGPRGGAGDPDTPDTDTAWVSVSELFL